MCSRCLTPNRFFFHRLHVRACRPIGIVVMLVCVASFLLASFADPGMVKPGERKAAAAKRGGKPAKRGKAKGSKGLEASAAGAPTSGKHPKKTDKSDPDDIADCEAVPADPSFCTLPFDGALYEGPAVCRTCGVVKPPRSKHCNMMGGCVARFDHYCVWLNAAVGERTYRWFLLYLISHTVVLLYGAVACASIFLSEIEEHRMLERTFVNTRTGEEIPASYGIIFQFLMSSNPELMMIQVLCAVMSVVLVGFTGYHIMLTATNMTTNETFKYSALPNKVRHRARVRQYVERRREAAGLPPTRRTAEQDRAEELAAAAPPVNPFDRGMLANFAEVIWPLSLRSAEEWPRIEYGQPPALDAETLAAQGADAKDIDELVVQELRQRAAARK